MCHESCIYRGVMKCHKFSIHTGRMMCHTVHIYRSIDVSKLMYI